LLDLPEHEAEGRLNQIERMIFYSRNQFTKPRAAKQGFSFASVIATCLSNFQPPQCSNDARQMKSDAAGRNLNEWD
jgi:hypothetical protein